MRPEGRDIAHLWDMLEHARIAVEITQRNSVHAFLKDRVLQLALERALEVVGEAAKRISADFRNGHPDIPWRRIIGNRNVLAHEYDDVVHELLWKTTTEDVPALVDYLEALLDSREGA